MSTSKTAWLDCRWDPSDMVGSRGADLILAGEYLCEYSCTS